MQDEYRYPHSLLSLPVLHPPVPPSTPGNPVELSSASGLNLASERLPANELDKKLLAGKVIEALREIFDPEIPVNIYELGLIYDINVQPDKTVKIKMTLTAPACPVAGSLPGEVERKVEAIPEVTGADVELVWEPPWSRDLMSEAALLTLGML